MNAELKKLASQAGLQVSGVKIVDRRGTRYLYFIKDRNGKLLNGGDSFEPHEVRPALEKIVGGIAWGYPA
jgi:hypothetical protein